MKLSETRIASFSLLLALLFLMGCPRDRQYQYTKIPNISECRFLSRSIFCTDKRLSNRGVDALIQYVQSQNSLSSAQKETLIRYFEENREQIVKTKEFEIQLAFSGFFRGYFLTTPEDEGALKNFVDERLLKLDRFIERYGDTE